MCSKLKCIPLRSCAFSTDGAVFPHPLPARARAEFLDAEGSTSAEFFAACKAATSSAKLGPETVFVNLLLATSDYPSFLQLMKSEADDAAAGEAAAKAGGSD